MPGERLPEPSSRQSFRASGSTSISRLVSSRDSSRRNNVVEVQGQDREPPARGEDAAGLPDETHVSVSLEALEGALRRERGGEPAGSPVSPASAPMSMPRIPGIAAIEPVRGDAPAAQGLRPDARRGGDIDVDVAGGEPQVPESKIVLEGLFDEDVAVGEIGIPDLGEFLEPGAEIDRVEVHLLHRDACRSQSVPHPRNTAKFSSGAFVWS